MGDWKNPDAALLEACGAARPDARFYDAFEPPFSIHGLLFEDGAFCRMPGEIARQVNEGVAGLYRNTAGGRLRFRTDSPYVVISAAMPNVGKMPHFAFTGSAGFDLYAGDRFIGCFMPPVDIRDGYAAAVNLPGAGLREITVHFPLYSDVSALRVGLRADARLLPPEPYRVTKPVVFYGSSITQGGCASRPGLAYTNLLSRMLSAEHRNLGFSGSARGETVMAEYLKQSEMSAFVLDYDHNAPDPAHLAATHEALFRAVREAQPELPVLMLSRPRFTLTGDEPERREIVRATWANAAAAGDGNVYFLDGPALMAACGDEGTVDGCHPNDLGFASMARAIAPVLREMTG